MGSEIAIPYLEDETRVLVRPFGPSNAKYIRYYIGDSWVKASNVWPIHFQKEMKWTAGGLSDPKCAEEFRVALKEMNNSSCEELQFKFVGTHDINFTYRKRPNVAMDSHTIPLTKEEKKARRMDYAIANGGDLVAMVDGSSLSAFMPGEQTSSDAARPHIVNCGYKSSDIMTVVNESLVEYFKVAHTYASTMNGIVGTTIDGSEAFGDETFCNPRDDSSVPRVSLLERIVFKLGPLIESHTSKNDYKTRKLSNCRKSKSLSKRIDIKRKKR